ncbi:unnamed protein product [Timema podura]|uniref:Uncharacterized protein n=1 Tax=Timema podura TaxID=61482 RepID=A0ABN7P1W9_TIMPD|nr:unnamed protein product [Timema podura]
MGHEPTNSPVLDDLKNAGKRCGDGCVAAAFLKISHSNRIRLAIVFFYDKPKLHIQWRTNAFGGPGRECPRFTNNKRWVHIDPSGAWYMCRNEDFPYLLAGHATGCPTRTVLEFVKTIRLDVTFVHQSGRIVQGGADDESPDEMLEGIAPPSLSNNRTLKHAIGL